MSEFKKIVGILLLMGMMIGCANTASEEVFVHLEEAVELENAFAEQQQLLLSAEEKEHALYEEMIALGMEAYEEIVERSNEAIALVEERLRIMDVEKESIEASYKEFREVEAYVSEVDEGAPRNQLKVLVETMSKRYDRYQLLYTNYREAAELDRALYEMLQDKELTIEALQKQINKVNEKYATVDEHKEAFNELTRAYNETKKSFYEAAKLDVLYE
ncbi:YkyA family protein [Halalkalibacterium ligniniphilum]|uniref:YkyA family protein n=1 Tax=Halalkalibacterium ligniniphilum TaxID=1134413 RepID=UPI00034B7915|nr:YkyA family protein [Halalkalibacterium ligniniphilum]